MFGTLTFNIVTSLYVFLVPLPILWMANIKLWKKIGLILLVSANCFVIAVAIIRGYLATAYLYGASQAIRWALWVCFVAVVTTNLPLFFPMIHRFATSVFPTLPTIHHIRTISVWERTGLTGRVPRGRQVQEGQDVESSQGRNEDVESDSDYSDTLSSVVTATDLESTSIPANRSKEITVHRYTKYQRRR
ncbi:hypothetical protein F4819DRAFT_253423 [Hypoxylon fuscum]|nr:hypothetical protein F4819DRAFT_253423 [Hypoxylon fuscum]